jgi:hypothetical protein
MGMSFMSNKSLTALRGSGIVPINQTKPNQTKPNKPGDIMFYIQRIEGQNKKHSKQSPTPLPKKWQMANGK